MHKSIDTILPTVPARESIPTQLLVGIQKNEVIEMLENPYIYKIVDVAGDV